MRKLLLATVAVLALAAPASAAVISDLGVDPTSASGAFSNSLGTSTSFFSDDYTFSLDRTLNLTIASAINVFPTTSDFITGFTGSVFAGTPAAPGAVVLGPDTAQIGCLGTLQCQFLAGSAVLPAGNYFLEISGTANGSSGYGGNLATVAVPGPIVGAGIPGILAAFGMGGWAWRRRKQVG